jgi:hypothetical protein
MHDFLELKPLINFSRYISLQAPLKLGFDDAIRARIECSICQPDTDAGPSADTFDQTAWIVYTILQRVRRELKGKIGVERKDLFRNIYLHFCKV